MIDRQQPGQQGGEAQPNQEKQPPLIRILSFDGGGIRGVAVARILTAIEAELTSSKNVPQSLREQATVMVGTSTGGLISLLMSMRIKEQNSTIYKDPMRALDILKLYQDQAGNIFVKSYNWIATSFIVLLFFVAVILGLIYLISGITFDYITDDHTAESTVWFYFLVVGLPILTLLIGYYVIKIYHTFLFNKFSQRGLKKIVENKFGADRLDKAVGMVGICATDLATNKSILLNSYRAKACPHDPLHNAELHLVAKATAAAPTYFKYVRFYTPKPDNSQKEVGPWIWGQKAEDTGSLYHYEKDLFKMEDGGTSNNNPASLGFKLARLYCKQKGYDVRTCRFQIISFGTGEAPRPGSTKKSQLTQQERQEELLEDASLLKHVWRKFVKYSKKIVDAWKPKLQGQDDSSGDANEDALEDEKFQTKSTWKFLLKKTLEVIGAIIRLALWPLYTIYIFTLGLFLRWAFKSDAGLIEILHRLQTNPFEMESKSNYVDEKLRRKAMTSNGRIQYARVQFRIRPYQKDNMDDYSKGNIGRLIWRADRYIKGEGTPLPGTTPFKDVVKMLLTEEHTLQKDDLDYSGTQATRPASQ